MFATCHECGMKVIPGEYHPYTACVLYKYTRQAEKVESMIRAVVQYGYEAAQNGVPLDDALRNIAASNNASTRPPSTVPQYDTGHPNPMFVHHESRTNGGG